MEVSDVDLAAASARLGEEFRIHVDDGTVIELELVEATPLSAAPATTAPIRSFSLLFRGPVAPVLGQGILALRNHTWGTCEIFLVPVGQDEAGTYYEAVFNRGD